MFGSKYILVASGGRFCAKANLGQYLTGTLRKHAACLIWIQEQAHARLIGVGIVGGTRLAAASRSVQCSDLESDLFFKDGFVKKWDAELKIR